MSLRADADPSPGRRRASGNGRAASSAWRNPGAEGERLEIEDFPSFLLMRLGSLAKTKLTRLYLERAGLSMPEWRLLALLDRFSPTSHAAIARHSTMDKAQISLTLRLLLARGWASSSTVPAGGGRRPVRTIAITARGRAVIRRVLPDARRVQVRLLGRLTASERAQFHSLLRKMVVLLESLDAGDAD